jgi:hypothetical protein
LELLRPLSRFLQCDGKIISRCISKRGRTAFKTLALEDLASLNKCVDEVEGHLRAIEEMGGAVT